MVIAKIKKKRLSKYISSYLHVYRTCVLDKLLCGGTVYGRTFAQNMRLYMYRYLVCMALSKCNGYFEREE